MKTLFSILIVLSAVTSTLYSPKAKAAAVLVSIATVSEIVAWTNSAYQYEQRGIGDPSRFTDFSIPIGIIAGGASALAGVIVNVAGGPLAAGIVLIALEENGPQSEEQIELSLSQRYNFLTDRETTSALALEIKEQADSMKSNDGIKFVRLSPKKIAKILEPADLTSEEIALISKDLE